MLRCGDNSKDCEGVFVTKIILSIPKQYEDAFIFDSFKNNFFVLRSNSRTFKESEFIEFLMQAFEKSIII